MKEKGTRDTAAAGLNAGCETRLVLAVLRPAVVPFSTAALRTAAGLIDLRKLKSRTTSR